MADPRLSQALDGLKRLGKPRYREVRRWKKIEYRLFLFRWYLKVGIIDPAVIGIFATHPFFVEVAFAGFGTGILVEKAAVAKQAGIVLLFQFRKELLLKRRERNRRGLIRHTVRVEPHIEKLVGRQLPERKLPEQLFLGNEPRLEHLGLGRTAVGVHVAGLRISARPAVGFEVMHIKHPALHDPADRITRSEERRVGKECR